jgi:hypothetical protein
MKPEPFTPETAKHFGRFSILNAATVIEGRPCGCEPYRDVFTYNRWRAQGFQVRKGEKSLRLPVIITVTVKNEAENTEESRRIGRNVPVFCRCQVDRAILGGAL